MKKHLITLLLSLALLLGCFPQYALPVRAASTDLLADISYCGDRSGCVMTAQQAAAFAEVIRREEARREQDARSARPDGKYQLDNQVVLFDTGKGVPAMLFVSSINSPQGFAYQFAYRSVWQWVNGSAVRFTLPTGWIWEGFHSSDLMNLQIYSDHLLACISDVAMSGEASSLAVFPFQNGVISSTPSTTALYRNQMDFSANARQEEYRINGKAVSKADVNAWEQQYGNGDNANALAGYRYYRQGGYNIKGMTSASKVLAVLDAYAVAESVAGFVDVPKNAYYAGPVEWAVNNGITKGIDKTHFGPNVGCTRGQVVTFLWRTAGSPAPQNTVNPFTDVKQGSFCYQAVLWAVENKITNGMSPSTFAPDKTCTRGQVVTFLWRFRNTPDPKNDSTQFQDVPAKAFYARAVAWAVENNITNGTDSTHFSPEATCTRGQVVTFLYRTMTGK